MTPHELLSPPRLVKQNRLLHGPGKGIKLDEFLMLRQVAVLGKEKMGRELNLSRVAEPLVHRIHNVYGPEGLFQLVMLAMAHDEADFTHFLGAVDYILPVEEMARTQPPQPIRCENASIRQSEKVSHFNTNVLQPSFSRKLYRAGRHHGSLVYGLGGPRILVSHPFQGRTGELYDLYSNSLDVVTSLALRGFRGTFHFLDFLPGLDHEIQGVPAWLIWFSVIASQSDLIIYVKEYEGDFRWAQELELTMTPDRVQKTIVSIPHDELRWAKKPQDISGMKTICIGEHGVMTEEQWLRMEAEHATPFIENYVDPSIPHDRLFVIDESGDFDEYPLDHPLYV